MKKSRLRLNKPVKMLTIVANPDSSFRPAAAELVPWRSRAQLSGGQMQRVAQACSQGVVGIATWLFGVMRRASDVAGVIRQEATRAFSPVQLRSAVPEERLPIATSSPPEAVLHETDLAHEVRMLRAQVHTQNKILAELTYVLLEERKRVRESDQLVGPYDRQSESKLLQVLQANGNAEEHWGTSKSTGARVVAD